MIRSSNFIWLHLPKTGGTSTARMFNTLAIAGVEVDDETKDSKHQSWDDRLGEQTDQSREGTQSQKPKIIITTRRLNAWLLSDWHHKTIKMGLDLPFEPVKSGLFYSLRLGGTWVAADYWIQYFKAEQCDAAIRLENLEEDANNIVLPLLPPRTSRLVFPRSNTNQYSKNEDQFFNNTDKARIRENNPKWASWEEKVYKN